jgi:hypothetical protein
MARFSAGGITTAGSTTLPVTSLYSTATMRARVREIGVFNTTATAVALRLVRLTTTGTRGAALTTGATYAEDPTPAICVAYNTHTVAPTMTDLGFRVQLGAAIGSGFVWTFDDFVLTIGAVANSGIGIAVDTGTGQPLSTYWHWTE